MKRFTILLFLVLCTVFSLQAQNVTLPYTQDFAALSQGDMNSDTGSPTPVSAGALQGIASHTRPAELSVLATWVTSEASLHSLWLRVEPVM